MKIVSLLPSATEIVFELGLGDHLEGVTYECDFPPEAASKPVVSNTALPQDRPLSAGDIDRLVGEHMANGQPLYQLEKELIQKIQPDLVLAQDLCHVCAVPSGHVAEALAEIGSSAQLVSLDPNTLSDILGGILTVGRATGTEDRARDLVEELQQRIERVRAKASRLPALATLCLEWSDPPYVGGHWIPGMVELAGGTPVLSEGGKPSRAAAWPEVADAAPEVAVFMPCGYYLEDAELEAQSLFGIVEFAGTPAARLDGVFAVDASSFFSRPGPRIVEGLEILAWAIHPESFAHPGPGKVARVSA